MVNVSARRSNATQYKVRHQFVPQAHLWNLERAKKIPHHNPTRSNPFPTKVLQWIALGHQAAIKNVIIITLFIITPPLFLLNLAILIVYIIQIPDYHRLSSEYAPGGRKSPPPLHASATWNNLRIWLSPEPNLKPTHAVSPTPGSMLQSHSKYMPRKWHRTWLFGPSVCVSFESRSSCWKKKWFYDPPTSQHFHTFFCLERPSTTPSPPPNCVT